MKNNYNLYLTFLVLLFSYFAFGQSGCNDLDITAVQDGSVCGEGRVTLSATPGGDGDEVVWFESNDTGNDTIPLFVGEEFVTPEINSTTSYWVSEILGSVILEDVGPLTPADIGVDVGPDNGSSSYYLSFDVHKPTTLVSVDVYPTVSGARGSIEVVDNSGNVLKAVNYTTNVSSNNGTQAQTVALNVSLNTGRDYRIKQGSQVVGLNLNKSTTPITYPFRSSNIDIVDNNFQDPHIYIYFYNWVYEEILIDCESTRKRVTATVNDAGDEDITSLPYSHTENTSTYQNNYAGEPGDDCGTDDDYLYGNDVVYKYTADDDYILSIDLTGLSEKNTGVFVYEDCDDIGNECVTEGSVNDKQSNHGFQVSVENGKDYYIVVTSEKPVDSFDYTLKVDGFTCANYPAPNGASNQDFIGGQALMDLDVNGLDLTWYDDSSLTNSIDAGTLLIDNTTYYVTQTFEACESGALTVTAHEVSCSVLEVTSTSPSSVCGEGSVTLKAGGAEGTVGTELHWYDAAVDGSLVERGNEFITPELEETTSYWVAEVAASDEGSTVTGQGLVSPSGGAVSQNTSGNGILFDAKIDFILESVDVYVAQGGGNLEITLFDDADNVIGVADKSISAGTTGPVTINLNLDVPEGDGYQLRQTSGSGIIFEAEQYSGRTPPLNYPIGVNGQFGEIIRAVSKPTGPVISLYTYYQFYNWTVSSGDVLCESPREEVVATVGNSGDIVVNEPLPYTDSASTKDYDNNYAGVAGDGCTSGDYLEGSDVVYQYSPSQGGVFSIELSDLSSDNAAVFVYESCFDIGDACYAGEVSDGSSSDFGIDEVIMNDGQTYFIVISTEHSFNTGYTLTIDEAQIDCADYTDAPEGEEEQYSQPGFTLEDLDVKGSNLTWYDDNTLGNILSETTAVVDSTTYYVTQTLNGCESDVLSVTAYEVDCSGLAVTSFETDTLICHGVATLKATGTGAPSTELYWYKNDSIEDKLAHGSTFVTPELNNTTSYWVSEVFLEGQTEESGYGKDAPTGTSAFGSTLNYGLEFDVIEDFDLVSVDVYPDESGEVEVSLFDDSDNLIDSATKNVSSGSGAVTIPLDFHIKKGTGYRLLQTSSPSISLIRDSGSDFPFDIGQNGEFGEITNGTYGTSTSNTTTYYYFYNWTVGVGEVICESPRQEVQVEVRSDGNEVVNTLPYTHSASTDDYGNHFEGGPGDDCGIEEGYLNGYEAVYSYTATDDDLITVELSDLTDYYAGVFIYDSCGALANDCSAAAIAGPSTDDIAIEDFPIEGGKTYYIVVSSWLTSSVDYTINIEAFSCADLAAPDGDSPQEFVAGDVVDDLVIDTRTGAAITWYEDSGLTQEITDPTTFDLVDGDSYYVTQTLEGCESPALEIVAEELDCSDLAIIDYTEDEVACRGELTLEAVGSGNGNEIYWYDDATGPDVIGIGEEFDTPELSQTTSYWAAEVRTKEGGGAMTPELLYYKFDETSGGITNHATNPVGNNPASLLGSGLSIGGSGLVGTALVGTGASSSSNYVDTGWDTDFSGSFTIGFWIDVDMNETGNKYIFGDLGAGSFRCYYNVSGASDMYFKPGNGLSTNFTIDGGDLFDGSGHFVHFVYDASAGALEAYIDGQLYKSESAPTSINWSKGNGMKIGGYSSSSGLYGMMDEFRIYDRALSQGEIASTISSTVDADVICESPRQEIVATVHQTGDIDLDYNDLPYTDADNTASFGNSFTGDAGDGCAGDGYLEGPDVSYFYTADPNEDDILDIELTGVNNPNAAIFVYESCGDVGYDCLDGATSTDGLSIEDFYVDAGDEILIVISSSSGSVGYTLNINGTDCNKIDAPTGDAKPYFISGEMVDDLEVDASAHNEGFKWYRDAGLTDEITDPANESLKDGDTYYVTQTLLGCESAAFEINPIEFDCQLMGADVPEDLYYVCAPGGEVTISADSTGLGGNIYWYDQESGGNTIGRGQAITVDVDEDTEIWAAEVFLGGETILSGQGKPQLDGGNIIGSIAHGLRFDVYSSFTLHSVDVYPGTGSYDITISLYDSSGNLLDYKETTVSAASSGDTQTIELDFDIPEGNDYTLIEDGGISNSLGYDSSTYANFPYDIGFNGSYGEITSGANSPTGSTNTSYYYFYNWNIIDVDIICESPRSKAFIKLNDEIPAPPTVKSLQEICGEGMLLSDITVLGKDLRWYGESGNELSPNTTIYEGETYYVTQTIKGCESNEQTVVMDFKENSDQPIANVNQSFEAGEDLTDLEVSGDNLRWYKDRFKSEELPAETLLEDQTTYYVTQEVDDMCESAPLGITVHRMLDVDSPLFENFEYYPNPVESKLHISNTENIERIQVYDLTGRKILDKKFGEQQITLDASNWAAATYLIKATVDRTEQTFVVIKK